MDLIPYHLQSRLIYNKFPWNMNIKDKNKWKGQDYKICNKKIKCMVLNLRSFKMINLHIKKLKIPLIIPKAHMSTKYA